MKKVITVFVLLVLIVIALFCSSSVFASQEVFDAFASGSDDPYATVEDDESDWEDTARVVVTELVSVEDSEDELGGQIMYTRVQRVWCRVLTGERKGQTVLCVFDLSNTLGGKKLDKPVEVGQKLLAFFTQDEYGDVLGTITGFIRDSYLLWMFILFFVFLLILTGKRGFKSVVALLVTCVGLLIIMIPLVLSGFSPVWAAVLACCFSICTTLLLVYGRTTKTLAAALGAVGGVIFAGGMAALMNAGLHMTGLCCGDAQTLALTVGVDNIDMTGILFASVVIGALGGTIDVGISIASALDEMREHAPKITAAEMMTSGLNIGSDIMGASLNTLILAYVGSSIHLLMLLWVNDIAFIDIINQENIAEELVRALAGSFGLLFTVPITSVVAAALMCKGGFGKLTPDMIPSIKAGKNAYLKLRSEWQKALAKAKSKTGEGEMPENLYEKAAKHREENDDGFFNGKEQMLEESFGSADFEDDFDDGGDFKEFLDRAAEEPEKEFEGDFSQLVDNESWGFRDETETDDKIDKKTGD